MESFERRPASLISSTDLAGPGVRGDQLDRLSDFARRAGDVDDVAPAGEVVAELERLQDRADREALPTATFAAYQLQTTVVPGADLGDLVRDVHQQLTAVTFHEDAEKQAFPHCGVHVIRRDASFLHRVHLPSVLLRSTHDPQLASPNPDYLARLKRLDAPVFDSSRGLLDGLMINDAYLGPLFGALSPFIWAVPIYRRLGTIVYSLGTTLSGGTGSASEVLQLLGQKGSDARARAPRLADNAAPSAIRWWTSRLNELFGALTDPTIHTDRHDRYLPQKQLHSLLSVEQMFRRVSSIQTSWRDTHARRVLLFTVLDTLERLTGRNLETLCSLPYAEKTVKRIRADMPEPAQTLLLPAAERAVSALREVQDGFFMRSTDATTIEVPGGSGQLEEMPLHKAAAFYVKILRNATHGHGSKHEQNRARTDTMLAQHNGAVPHDLALLGYLYLLDVLSNVDRLVPQLYRSGND